MKCNYLNQKTVLISTMLLEANQIAISNSNKSL